MIYLNNAATSWPKPEAVYVKADACLRHLSGSANRGAGEMALLSGREILETRELVADFFAVQKPEQIIFTANATEGLNLALQGLLNAGDHVIISSMEHNALVRPLSALRGKGITYTIATCSPDGTLNLQAIEKAINTKTKLICLTHASNVCGTIMPINEVGDIARRYKLQYLVDAAQSAAEIPINVETAAISLLVFTGHKILMGPPGIGGLYIRNPDIIKPLIYGGTGSKSEMISQPDLLPDKYESGTLNVPAIAALGAGIKFIQKTGLDNIRRHNQELVALLLEGLQSIGGIVIYGVKDAKKMVPVVSINIEGISAGEASNWLAKHHDIATRAGLHCAPLAHRTMGTLNQGTLRLSPGFFTTAAEIHQTIDAIKELVKSNENE